MFWLGARLNPLCINIIHFLLLLLVVSNLMIFAYLTYPTTLSQGIIARNINHLKLKDPKTFDLINERILFKYFLNKQFF